MERNLDGGELRKAKRNLNETKLRRKEIQTKEMNEMN